MTDNPIRTASGRPLEELTLQAVLAGQVREDEFRISRETLHRQADAAEKAGYGPLAENLRRAAELTALSNDQVLDIYAQLRPGRASYGQLIALAERLEREYNASRTASLIREAAEVYRARGLVPDE
jgi:propanediol dehydratase small subunit